MTIKLGVQSLPFTAHSLNILCHNEFTPTSLASNDSLRVQAQREKSSSIKLSTKPSKQAQFVRNKCLRHWIDGQKR
jgi:hypothetical protein